MRRVPLAMVVSIAFGSVSVVGGLVLSFHHGTAGGATISGLSVALFFVVLAGVEVRRLVQRRAA